MASTVVTSVSLTPELIATIKSIAEADGLKVSAVIESCLWKTDRVRKAAKSIGVERQDRKPVGRPAVN